MKQITNLGKAISILASADAREIALHADVSAWGAPSECHEDVSRSEAERQREARHHAEAVAGAPLRVIVKQAKRRGFPMCGPQWERLVGRIYDSFGLPY